MQNQVTDNFLNSSFWSLHLLAFWFIFVSRPEGYSMRETSEPAKKEKWFSHLLLANEIQPVAQEMKRKTNAESNSINRLSFFVLFLFSG